MNQLKTRVFSAAVALAALALSLYFAPHAFTFITLVAVLICSLEYAQLTGIGQVETVKENASRLDSNVKSVIRWRWSWIFVAFSGLIFLSLSVFSDGSFHRALVLWIFASILWLTRASDSKDLRPLLQEMSFMNLGLVYCGVLPSFAVQIVQWPERGVIWITLLLAMVFAGETFSFLIGTKMGRKKILPALSPSKTLEGALAGLAGSVLAAFVFWFWQFSELPLVLFVFMAFVISFFAQCGDFFESLLKRVANVKDSGGIMPGHGGLLDRVDGVLFALPFYYGFAYTFQLMFGI